VRIGDTVAGLWTRYTIDLDLLVPADRFDLSLAPGSREVFDLCRTDAEVSVLVDKTPILTGYIERRVGAVTSQSSGVEISGYDGMGRLVAESMPLIERLPRLSLAQLMGKVADPWFPVVTFSNARNRRLVRGRGARIAGGAEPVFADRRSAPKKVEPGETRWEVGERALRETDLLAWSSGDGLELIVGAPSYDQEPQYRFFLAAPESRRAAETNVLAFDITDDIGGRFSEIRVVGAGRGNAETYGAAVTAHEATAVDATGDFLRPKRQILSHSKLRSADEATRIAQRELYVRAAGGRVVNITAKGHSQALYPGAPAALFALDTVADVEVEEWGIRGRFLVVGLTFLDTGQDGETTQIRLVPVGTHLAL
jgi:prophage tail gpP-like protein